MSLFIRAPDLGFLKPLYSKAPFFIFDPARKIRDTNEKLGWGLPHITKSTSVDLLQSSFLHKKLTSFWYALII